jgi:hypothetical protein
VKHRHCPFLRDITQRQPDQLGRCHIASPDHRRTPQSPESPIGLAPRPAADVHRLAKASPQLTGMRFPSLSPAQALSENSSDWGWVRSVIVSPSINFLSRVANGVKCVSTTTAGGTVVFLFLSQ